MRGKVDPSSTRFKQPKEKKIERERESQCHNQILAMFDIIPQPLRVFHSVMSMFGAKMQKVYDNVYNTRVECVSELPKLYTF